MNIKKALAGGLAAAVCLTSVNLSAFAVTDDGYATDKELDYFDFLCKVDSVSTKLTVNELQPEGEGFAYFYMQSLGGDWGWFAYDEEKEFRFNETAGATYELTWTDVQDYIRDEKGETALYNPADEEGYIKSNWEQFPLFGVAVGSSLITEAGQTGKVDAAVSDVVITLTDGTELTIPGFDVKGDLEGKEEDWGLSGTNVMVNMQKVIMEALPDPEPDYDLEYKTTKDGTVEITGYAGEYTEIVIPSKIKRKPVTSIGDSAFAFCDILTSVTIPDSVVSIGNSAFSGCSNLTSINIPNSVTDISSAFSGCSSLESITIPGSVTNISYAFSGCSNLKSITIPNSVTNISGAFSGCSNLKSITIPNSVTNISGAFYGCSSLKSITFGNGVTSIGDYAFSECTSLESIIIPNGVTNIGEEAFFGCSNLKKITIPSSVTSIGEYAFYEYFADIYYSGTMEEWKNIAEQVYFGPEYFTVHCSDGDIIGEYAEGGSEGYYEYGDFACALNKKFKTAEIVDYTGSETAIVIPSEIDGKKVISIGVSAFSNCSNIESIVIPDSVTSIGNSAFYDCDGLTNVYYTGTKAQWSEITIDDFNECLTKAVIHCSDGDYTKPDEPDEPVEPDEPIEPDEPVEPEEPDEPDEPVEPEEPDELITDNGLKYSITDDNTVEIIGYTGNDTDIVIPSEIDGKKVTSIGKRAFANNKTIKSVTVPDSVTSINEAAFAWTSLKKAVLGNSVETIGTAAFYYCSDLESVSLSNSVKTIGGSAFGVCTALSDITIPNSVTDIKDSAFFSTSLKSITIPASVENIGAGVFAECIDLAEINVAAANKKYCSDNGVLYNKDKSILIRYPCGIGAATFTVPSGVVQIEDSAFFSCRSLTSITIPSSVTSIGNAAFAWCENLKDVYYTGTEAQWKKMEITNDNVLLNANIHYNYTQVSVSDITGLKLAGRAADALRIAWSKNTSADGYIVEMYKDGKWTRVTKITKNTTTEWRQSGLAAGTVYKFRVRAYKMDGKTAIYSNYKNISACTNPSKIAGLKLKGRANNALRIAWNKNTSADGYIVEMYKGGKWTRVTKITKNTTTEWRQSGLAAGTAYKFRVKAYKMNGKTAVYSSYVNISARTNPSNVTGVKTLGRAKNAVRFGWTKNTSADGYIVEMYKSGKWVRAAKITSNATVQFKKTGLKANTTYKFRVRAYKMSGKTALYSGYTNINIATTK